MTNAVRLLKAAKITHIVHQCDVSDGKIDGVNVALKIGKEPERVFKTLVAVGKNTGVNVFVIPVDCELDLKKAARICNEKSIEMIKSRDLEPLTGYVHGGCSPICMKKSFPTFIEETAELHDTVIFSAGRIGMQIEMAPSDLIKVSNAVYGDLVKSETQV